MDTKFPYWGSVIFSTVALVLLVVNVSLSNANRAAQVDVQDRQNTIAAGQTYSQINQGLVQALADAAVKNNNVQIRDLLVSQGITIKDNAAEAKPAATK